MNLGVNYVAIHSMRRIRYITDLVSIATSSYNTNVCRFGRPNRRHNTTLDDDLQDTLNDHDPFAASNQLFGDRTGTPPVHPFNPTTTRMKMNVVWATTMRCLVWQKLARITNSLLSEYWSFTDSEKLAKTSGNSQARPTQNSAKRSKRDATLQADKDLEKRSHFVAYEISAAKAL